MPRSAICYSPAMDTRQQVSANLLGSFVIVAIAPCCWGEQQTPSGGALTPPAAWQPSAGHTQIPLWPGGAPGARPAEGAEVTGYGSKQVAGRPWVYVDRVTQPTITVYSPKRKNSGAAV